MKPDCTCNYSETATYFPNAIHAEVCATRRSRRSAVPIFVLEFFGKAAPTPPAE